MRRRRVFAPWCGANRQSIRTPMSPPLRCWRPWRRRTAPACPRSNAIAPRSSMAARSSRSVRRIRRPAGGGGDPRRQGQPPSRGATARIRRRRPRAVDRWRAAPVRCGDDRRSATRLGPAAATRGARGAAGRGAARESAAPQRAGSRPRGDRNVAAAPRPGPR